MFVSSGSLRFLLLFFLFSSLLHAQSAVNVLTWHNDILRSGDNLNETILTPANVNPTQFGKIFSYPVDGMIYAQPLYVHDVVIPGAKQKKISAVATVPGAASISADPDHAVVLVLVDQTTLIGADAPVNTASSVKVTLDKVHDRWLISQFDPV